MATMYCDLGDGTGPKAFEVEDKVPYFVIGGSCPKCGDTRRITSINHTNDWYRCEKLTPQIDRARPRRRQSTVQIGYDYTQHDSIPERYFTLCYNSLEVDYHTK